MFPSLHYLGVIGFAAFNDHSRCAAQNERIKAERADEYGPDGAYSHQVCIHGELFEGRGWNRDAAANGQNPPGVWHNQDSRSLCMLVGTDDDLTPALEATVRAWYSEALARGMDAPLQPHSFFVPTACPGDNGRALIDKINANPDPGGFLMALSDAEQAEVLAGVRALARDGVGKFGIPNVFESLDHMTRSGVADYGLPNLFAGQHDILERLKKIEAKLGI